MSGDHEPVGGKVAEWLAQRAVVAWKYQKADRSKGSALLMCRGGKEYTLVIVSATARRQGLRFLHLSTKGVHEERVIDLDVFWLHAGLV